MKNSQKQGLRVRLMFTFTSIGGLEPIFVVIHGLKPDGMDDSGHLDGLYVLKIPGLCPGGDTGQNLHGFGYVAFCNTKKNINFVRHSWYCNNVLLPYIDEMCTYWDEWENNNPVPEELHVVFWCNGNINQIKSIVNKEQQALEFDKKIVSNKDSGHILLWNSQQICQVHFLY